MAELRGLSDLPLELIELIIGFLDVGERPSSRSLREEPSSALCRSTHQPIKCFSQTCRSLRKLTMNELFKFMVVNVLVQMGSSSSLLQQAEFRVLREFVVKNELRSKTQSVAVEFILLPQHGRTALREGFAANVCSEIMKLLNPETLTVMIPPSLAPYLAFEVAEGQDQADGWMFDAPLHILAYTRSLTQNHERPDSRQGSSHFWRQEGPWDSITLNEGSSMKVYSNYEYYLRKPPSVFLSRSFQELIRWTWAFSLRRFEYVALFPVGMHVHNMLRILQSLSRLELLTIQLGPASSDILDDCDRLGRCTINDLWMEMHECYLEAFNFVRHSHKWTVLKTFRSLDWPKYASQIPYSDMGRLDDWAHEGGDWTFSPEGNREEE